jgi:16S rRNA (guanine527-N7)-methyltransferase
VKVNGETWQHMVIDGALALGVEVSVDQARMMGCHARELIRWNRATNLTAITDPLDMAVKHYVDSLAAVPWIGAAVRVVDAGSGGGFPGIPLKILRPDLQITMIDSVRKKISFLKHTIRTLGLQGINAVHGRLEALGRQPAHRQGYDLVICRAFSALDDFAARATGLLTVGGCLMALKGPQTDDPQEDCGDSGKAIIHLGKTAFGIHIQRYQLPILKSQRRLVKLTPLAET